MVDDGPVYYIHTLALRNADKTCDQPLWASPALL